MSLSNDYLRILQSVSDFSFVKNSSVTAGNRLSVDTVDSFSVCTFYSSSIHECSDSLEKLEADEDIVVER